MGNRNRDRVSMTDWRRQFETVLQMWKGGWRDVRASCDTCKAEFQIDLEKVIREKGPKTSLWNRRQPCPKADCPGTVQFTVRIPGLYQHRLLIAPDPAMAPKRMT